MSINLLSLKLREFNNLKAQEDAHALKISNVREALVGTSDDLTRVVWTNSFSALA
jgi:hypothetical protein